MKIATRRSSQKGAFAAIEATEYTAELSYYEDNTLAAVALALVQERNTIWGECTSGPTERGVDDRNQPSEAISVESLIDIRDVIASRLRLFNEVIARLATSESFPTQQAITLCVVELHAIGALRPSVVVDCDCCPNCHCGTPFHETKSRWPRLTPDLQRARVPHLHWCDAVVIVLAALADRSAGFNRLES